MPFRLRHMHERDLPAVMKLQAEAYPTLAESAEAIGSRLEHAPRWCWVAEGGDDISAYLITHPWLHTPPPEWNVPLLRLPVHGTRFYIHDLALGRSARGSGLARRLIHTALENARRARFHEAHLVAVQGSVEFWQRQGFHSLQVPSEKLKASLQSYGEDARLLWRRL